MRYIPLLDRIPPQDWLDRAARAAADLEEVKHDRVLRDTLIKRNSAIWSGLKDWLLELSNQKCWYSEAKDCFQDWDVEHYRPKVSAKNIDNSERDGYWWLSFDWRNYRICGRVGNIKKGTFFPVRGLCADENNRTAVEDELPYLLDPICRTDCLLLSFNQLGEAIPAPGLDDWSKTRVVVSVQRYKLDYDKLALMRKDIWDTCTALIHEIQNLMSDQQDNPSANKKTKIEEKIKQLASYTLSDRVCSSVAIVCLQKSEIGWAIRLSGETI